MHLNSYVKGGFTLLEMMVVFAIIGILAGISVPGMLKAQAKARYENEIKEGMDMVLESRTNAIAGRACEQEDGTSVASSYWSVFVEKKYDNKLAEMRVTCFGVDGSGYSYLDKEFRYADIDTILFDTGEFDAGGGMVMEVDEASSWVSAEMKFLSGNNLGVGLLQLNRSYAEDPLEDSDIVSKKKVKVVFKNERLGNQVLCFSRIAGYPTLNKDALNKDIVDCLE